LVIYLNHFISFHFISSSTLKVTKPAHVSGESYNKIKKYPTYYQLYYYV